MDAQKKQLLDKIQAATNILVTVSSNPSVDQLAAAIGLSLMLNKMDKHASAVFSGEVPSTMEFLRPAETLEKDTNSLRDFIISLDKSKADKLRYKVEDKVVKIFITPYRTSLTQDDLEFSEGDFNVELVIALGVREQTDLDEAITSHGRILHDATVTTITNGDESHLGSINWRDTTASSLSELITELSKDMGKKVIDGQIATALLTGIVAATDRFRNEHTSAKTMSVSADLMSAGANQQLVTSELEHTLEVHDQAAGDQGNQGDKLPEANQLPTAVDDQAGKPAELDIDHGGQPEAKPEQADQGNKPPAIPELPELPKPMSEPGEAKTDDGLPTSIDTKPEHELPQIRHVRADTDQNKEPEPYDIITKRHDMVSAPNLDSPMSANSHDQDGDENSAFDPLTGGQNQPPSLLSHDHSTMSQPPEANLPLPTPLPSEPKDGNQAKPDKSEDKPADKPEDNSVPVDLPSPWNPTKDETKPAEDGIPADVPTGLPTMVPDEPKPESKHEPSADTPPPLPGDLPKADEPKAPEPPKPTVITPDTPPLPPMPQFGPVPPVPPIPPSPFQPPQPTGPAADTPKPDEPKPPEPPSPTPAGQSLADLEKSVKADKGPGPAAPTPPPVPPPMPPMPSAQPPAPAKGNDVDAARDEVMRALSEQPDDATPPIMALNAQPMGPDALHPEAPQPAAPVEPTKTDPLAPTGTPTEPPSPADRPLDMPLPQPGSGLNVPPPQIIPPTNSANSGPGAPPPPVPPPMMPPPQR